MEVGRYIGSGRWTLTTVRSHLKEQIYNLHVSRDLESLLSMGSGILVVGKREEIQVSVPDD